MANAQLIKDVRIGQGEVRDGIVTEDQPLEHGLVDDTPGQLLVGAERLQPCLRNRGLDHLAVDRIEVDRLASRVGLPAERHQDEAKRRRWHLDLP